MRDPMSALFISHAFASMPGSTLAEADSVDHDTSTHEAIKYEARWVTAIWGK